MSNQTFDLGVNNQVPLTAIAGDANGNQVTGLPTAFTADDSAVVTVTDNGDGTCVVARVSVSAGTATVTASVSNTDGTTVSGALTITLAAQTVAPGVATDVTIVPGTPS